MSGKSRGPLLALIAIVATALSLTAFELARHRYTVTAADGTSLVIETDPARIVGKDGQPAILQARREADASGPSGAGMPEGSGREANLVGTRTRDG